MERCALLSGAPPPSVQADGVRMLREEVTEVDIADIVSKWTGIPVRGPITFPTPTARQQRPEPDVHMRPAKWCAYLTRASERRVDERARRPVSKEHGAGGQHRISMTGTRPDGSGSSTGVCAMGTSVRRQEDSA